MLDNGIKYHFRKKYVKIFIAMKYNESPIKIRYILLMNRNIWPNIIWRNGKIDDGTGNIC